MKKTMLSLFLISALGLGASAQSNNGANNDATYGKQKWRKRGNESEQNEKRFDEGMKKAGLTDEQISKMKTANTDYASKVKAIRDDKALDEKARQSKLQELDKQKDKDYENILGKDKYKEYKSKFDKSKADYKDARDNAAGDRRQWKEHKKRDEESSAE